MRGTVRVIFNTLDFSWNIVFTALEINDSVSLLMAAATMANGDPTGIVATSVFRLGCQQRSVGLATG